MSPTKTFKALMVDMVDGETESRVQELGQETLPDGDVRLSVAYSSLNYKDGLAVTGSARVLRSFPMVPGVDLAGTVVESAAPAYKEGDQVLVTGYQIGEKYWGGYTQLTQLKSEWLVPLPTGLTLKGAMTIGTAGFTAMLSVMALEEHGLKPDQQGPVVVTGAGGGVGGMAVTLLSQLGYQVVASTGRAEIHDYLRQLGANEFIDRAVLATPSKRPLESGRWIGAIDAVGGDTLAGLIKAMAPGGSIAASGNAGGVALNTTVLPFILRGVNLLGIDSNMTPQTRRRRAWQRLAKLVPDEALQLMTYREAGLEEVPELAQDILDGKIRGRVVIKVT